MLVLCSANAPTQEQQREIDSLVEPMRLDQPEVNLLLKVAHERSLHKLIEDIASILQAPRRAKTCEPHHRGEHQSGDQYDCDAVKGPIEIVLIIEYKPWSSESLASKLQPITPQ